MNYENDKKQLIYVLLAVVIPFTVYKLVSTFILPNIADNIVRPFTGEVIFAGITVVAAILVKKIWTMKFSGKSMGKGFLAGWPMIVMIIYSFVMLLVAGGLSVTVSAGKVVLLVVTAILVGISEELLIRGILINGLTDYYGNITPSVLRKSIVISAAVFGALHLFNVFTGVTVGSAIIQAVSAMLMGIFFGIVYIRSNKNLWACIILHAAWDFIGFLGGGMLMGQGTDDTINKVTLTALIPSVIFVTIALINFRDKKLMADQVKEEK